MTRGLELQHPTGHRGLDMLLVLQLIQCEYIARHSCHQCGRNLGMWFYGFPMPLCAFCLDRERDGRARRSQRERIMPALPGLVRVPATT